MFIVCPDAVDFHFFFLVALIALIPFHPQMDRRSSKVT